VLPPRQQGVVAQQVLRLHRVAPVGLQHHVAVAAQRVPLRVGDLVPDLLAHPPPVRVVAVLRALAPRQAQPHQPVARVVAVAGGLPARLHRGQVAARVVGVLGRLRSARGGELIQRVVAVGRRLPVAGAAEPVARRVVAVAGRLGLPARHLDPLLHQPVGVVVGPAALRAV
jgi:hypothetical protein